jgi:hypothetical protein
LSIVLLLLRIWRVARLFLLLFFQDLRLCLY